MWFRTVPHFGTSPCRPLLVTTLYKRQFEELNVSNTKHTIWFIMAAKGVFNLCLWNRWCQQDEVILSTIHSRSSSRKYPVSIVYLLRRTATGSDESCVSGHFFLSGRQTGKPPLAGDDEVKQRGISWLWLNALWAESASAESLVELYFPTPLLYQRLAFSRILHYSLIP